MDVAQTAFLTLLESQDSLQDDERLVGWLVTITRTAGLAGARAAAPRAPGGRAARVSTPDRAQSTAEGCWTGSSSACCTAAVEQLGSPCRELISALYFDARQPTYAQIARTLGRSVGGIGPLRGRCLATLRQTMEEAS